MVSRIQKFDRRSHSSRMFWLHYFQRKKNSTSGSPISVTLCDIFTSLPSFGPDETIVFVISTGSITNFVRGLETCKSRTLSSLPVHPTAVSVSHRYRLEPSIAVAAAKFGVININIKAKYLIARQSPSAVPIATTLPRVRVRRIHSGHSEYF